VTLGEKLAKSLGRPSGFDYMRIVLATCVVCWHTIVITYGTDFQNLVWATPEYRVLIAWILPVFFALSGLLVAGSLERATGIVGFLYLRMIRIFPALIVEILLSALILGPLLTKFDSTTYFSSPMFWAYFLNCLGDIHFALPGVFTDNPTDKVNGQLWTVPYELYCYVALAVLVILRLAKRQWQSGVLVAGLVVFGIYKSVSLDSITTGPFSGRLLVACFLVGNFFYLNRSWIPHNRMLGAGSIAVALVCVSYPRLTFLSPLPIVYATAFLGLLNPRKLRVLSTGDYSYGIFLYGFPIQQAVVASGLFPRNGFANLIVAYPFIVMVAVCSWHLCEKRVLGLKKFRNAIDSMFCLGAAVRVARSFALLGKRTG